MERAKENEQERERGQDEEGDESGNGHDNLGDSMAGPASSGEEAVEGRDHRECLHGWATDRHFAAVDLYVLHGSSSSSAFANWKKKNHH